jgi:hypothetical protein
MPIFAFLSPCPDHLVRPLLHYPLKDASDTSLPETVFTPSSTIMYISTGNLKVTMRLEKDSGLEGLGARHKKIACRKS